MNHLLSSWTLFGRPTGNESRLRYSTVLGACLAGAFLLMQAPVVLAQNTHTLPLFMSASDMERQGFARIINRSDRRGTVTIRAIDDSGDEADLVTLTIAANATVHFNSGELEEGGDSATRKGLSGTTGSGEGNWRLKLETDLDIEPLAYIRTPADGFLTSIHDVAQGESMRWNVAIFNPGKNTNQKSLLRLINTSGIDTDVTITGLDDQGNDASGGEVQISLPADEARLYSAADLEDGHSDFDGSLGAGSGKWQLFVSADRPIQVMSLMSTPTGHMTSLSSTTGDTTLRGGPGGDELRGGAGDDVINPGDNGDNEIDIVHGSAGDDRIVYTDSGRNGIQSLRYSELTAGTTVTIEGAVNRATVDKGSAGTDTIVDIANPLDAGGSPPFNGVFELRGTPFDDTFDLALGDEQWMDIAGNAGADTFNIESGAVRIDYETSPAGVDVDLDDGEAADDGFGDSDTFNGTVWGVAGSDFDDVLRGSDRPETFWGRAGNDTIDGRGGRDRLHFGSNNPRYAIFYDVGDIDLDLEAGTATGTWNGMAFSYTLSNIEEVRTGAGDDTLLGTDGNDRLNGSDGNDTINPRDSDGNDLVYGSAGSDRIVYSDSTGDRAYQHLTYLWSYDAFYDQGLTVEIDGANNSASVGKGSHGTDTIVDIANPMSRWGFGIEGTSHDDVFTLTVDNGQWMQFSGGPGDDTFNISGGGSVTADGVVRADYLYPAPRNGIEVDLASGRASDDGFGDVDTFNGRVGQFRGTDLSDSIRGSDNDEFFIGRRGNDTIDGRGGRDTLQFDRTGVRDVVVDLAAGTATGIWGDSAYIHRTPWFLAPVEERAVGSLFTYEVSNIEVVWGSRVGRDRLLGSERDERLEGRQGDDVLDGRGGNDDLYGGDGNDTLIGGGSVNRDGRNDDKLEGGAGNDTFVIGYGDGFNTIHDFTNGEDRIDLSALGFASYSDLRAVISLPGNGTGTWIDLSRYGGGGVSLWQYFDINGLDASDFLL